MRGVFVMEEHLRKDALTLNLLMSYIYIHIYGRDFVLGILLLEPYISLIYARKTNKYTNYSFSLLIMYGSSYMFRHYIAIFREHS
jgi:hypothetical protein